MAKTTKERSIEETLRESANNLRGSEQPKLNGEWQTYQHHHGRPAGCC